MTSDRKKPSVAFWATVVVVAGAGLAALPFLFRVADRIATDLYLGENQSPPPEDVGPVYMQPPDAKPDHSEYGYAATPEREAQIIAGFRNLKVGQSREEVRDVMGLPDSAEPMYRKARNMPFIGWKYLYEIKTQSGPPKTSNVYVSVYFNPDGNLHWAVPNRIAGLEEVGGYNRGTASDGGPSDVK